MLSIFPGNSSPLYGLSQLHRRWRGYIRSHRMIPLLYLKTPKKTPTQKPSSQLTSDLFISCQKLLHLRPKHNVLSAWLARFTPSLFLKIYEWTGWQSFLTHWHVCVHWTSCHKMCDFPWLHSWAVKHSGKTPFAMECSGTLWAKHPIHTVQYYWVLHSRLRELLWNGQTNTPCMYHMFSVLRPLLFSPLAD